MAKGRQFLLLLWKNYLIQKRKVLVTILEILVPTLFALILILIRQRVESYPKPLGQNFTGFSVLHLPFDLFLKFPATPKLAFTPDNNATRSIMATVGKNLRIETEGHGFGSEDEMVNFIMSENATLSNFQKYLGGIVFQDSFHGDLFPFNISFKIRLSSSPRNASAKFHLGLFKGDTSWMTGFMFPMFQRVGPRTNSSIYGGPPDYYKGGFLALQNAISVTITKYIQGDMNGTEMADQHVYLNRHPYPPFNDDPFVLVIQQQLPLVLILSFVLCALNIVKDIVHEKERKLKESMKMMGLDNWLHWTAWFVKYFLFLLITVTIMTFFFCVNISANGSVIGKTDPSLILIFLLVYSISSIAFSCAVSTFFNKANSAAAAGGILFFVTYIPYFFIQPHYDTMSWGVKISVSLLSNVGMAMGAQVIGMFEGTGDGVQWSNMSKGVSVDDDFALLHVIIVLLVDTVIYLLITWYVEAVFPGEYGIPHPWYFPVSKIYWCGTSAEDLDEEHEPLLGKPSQDVEYFEKDPVGLRPGIKIQNLRKEFDGKVAVEGMNLNMYEGQITALLGHNGAGKTTTMSMLTGFIPATGGTAIVNGYNIREDIASVRNSLGLCPQHDVLFDTLTVTEHLNFFAGLKGYPRAKMAEEVNTILLAIGLQNKRNAQSKTLSGGMKRKLSVGIALIGDSKIVILDEPSSGMDPDARRHIWNVLQGYRAGRTMLLTTHFMDEADLLGDRIAIMANGVIQCCGSSLFLKKKYGAGYHMVIVKDSSCKVEDITELVQGYVPQATLESNVGMELSYILPQESSNRFEELFTELENNKVKLGISSYGASVTTMEEVFLKVGETTDMGLMERLHNRNGLQYQTDLPTESQIDRRLNPGASVEFSLVMKRNTDVRLYAQQFFAMFYKRVLHTWRNKLVTLTQIFVPLLFLLAALIVTKTFPDPEDSGPLPLTPDDFDKNTVVYALSKMPSSMASEFAHYYSEQLKDSSSKVLFVNNQKGYKMNPDIIKYLFVKGEEGLARYNREFMVACDITNTVENDIITTAYFNNQGYHTSAMSLAVLLNATIKYNTNSSYSLQVINHPLPRTLNDKAQDEMTKGTTGFFLAFNIIFGMSFLASSFILFLVKERAVKAKHIQFVSGVHTINFWLSTFCWDLVNFMIPSILLVVSFTAFDIQAYVGDGRWLLILLLFAMFGWAMLPFMYLMSFVFTVPSSGFVWLTMFNIVSGVATLLAVGILSIPQLGLESLSEALKWVFLTCLPSYCLGQALEDFYSNYEGIQICGQIPAPILEKICIYTKTPCCKNNCSEFCFHYNTNYLGWDGDGIGRELVFLFIQGLIFFTIVWIIESEILIRIWYHLRPRTNGAKCAEGYHGNSRVQEDSDVQGEQIRIANLELSHSDTIAVVIGEDAALSQPPQYPHTDTLVLDKLTKYYGSNTAVDHLSLGVPQGECFGLLGINGAGKTTTFKMLTGDETMSAGNAYVEGYDVQNNIKLVQQKLGYCPQFDALIDQMTGRETLTMYARLRGVNERQIPAVVDALIKSLLLEAYADILVKGYSGGNKRKLSTAIALVGDPPIIFLDEPTTGMDPVARRLLLDTLSRVRDSGRTLILTSHSMEECEALCTRIAIMVNGQFKCLGSPQHLKNKFGQGYTLLAKVAYPEGGGEPDLQPLMSYIEGTFPGSVLKDVHEGMVHYHVTDTQLSWAHVFGSMERAKASYNIEDYSVSQTTLELVFINFARSQVPPNEQDQGCCRSCRLFCCCCCGSAPTVLVVDPVL